MSAVLFGLITAVCWGCADFMARFTGRAMGPDVALSGMLLASAVLLTLLSVLSSAPLIESLAEWQLIVATGLGVMAATPAARSAWWRRSSAPTPPSAS